jgi:starch synthase
VVLLDTPEFFDRDGLYGIGTDDYGDNPRRFAFLCLAALEYAGRRPDPPVLLHAHEWQTGLASVYLRTRYRAHPELAGVASVFTIHNLAYQGVFAPDWLPALGLGPELYAQEALEYWGHISFLKGGINFSDVITTVSRTYAREILTPELGFGFDGILQRRAGDLVGILNGIDVDTWNPGRDPHLPEPFSAERLDGKRAAKRLLLTEMGLPHDNGALERPVVGLVSRLVDQKGFDIVAEVADELPSLEASFVLLGSGDPRFESQWTELARRHPNRIAVRIGFDERVAHLIEAGSDMFLMPSRFEPCGLNQLYSFRYGTVPIVRATGGLDETVKDYNERRRTGTGFKFEEPTGEALLATLKRALRVYPSKVAWQAIQRAGMRQDYSWDAAAREYVKVYRKALRRSLPSAPLGRRGAGVRSAVEAPAAAERPRAARSAGRQPASARKSR